MDKKHDWEASHAVSSDPWSFYEDITAQNSILDNHADKLFSTSPDEKEIIDIETCYVTSAGTFLEVSRDGE